MSGSKISIVTPSFNQAAFVEDTLRSVLDQDYPHLEYVVIDGGSTDGTLEIIQQMQQRYPSRISQVIVGKDKGIYDAMNKGIKHCTGEVVGILNSDDFYATKTVIEHVVKLLTKTKAQSCYADLQYVNRVDTDKVLRHWRSGKYDYRNFLAGWMPPHPTFFVRRNLYDKLGYFDLELKSAADYELMLRFLYRHRISSAYLPEVIIRMRVGGLSNQSVAHRLRANNEDKLAWAKNGLKPRFYTIPLKPLRKLPQFILGRLGLAGKI
jgi:glycosyltransferase